MYPIKYVDVVLRFFIPLGVPKLTTVFGSVVFLSVIDFPNMLRNGGVFEPIDGHVIGQLVDYVTGLRRGALRR